VNTGAERNHTVRDGCLAHPLCTHAALAEFYAAHPGMIPEPQESAAVAEAEARLAAAAARREAAQADGAGPSNNKS
jgi:hypothetical protein